MCPFALSNCRLPQKISNGNKNDRLLLTSTLIFFFPARFSLNVKNKNIATALKEHSSDLSKIITQITVYMATFRRRRVNSTVLNVTRRFTNEFNS